MASDIASAFVRIRPNMTGFKAETEAGVVGAFRGAFSKVGLLAGGVFAVAGIAEAFKHVAEAAAGHEAAFAVLDKAITNVGASTKGFGQSLDSLLAKEARLKGFNDEQLAQSMVRLVSATHNTTTALRDLGLAEDLSRARHIDLSVAALAISKAEQGVTTSLQRYGIIIPKVSAATALLKQRHDEAAAAGAKFTGQIGLEYKAQLAAAAAADKHAKRVLAIKLIQERFGGAAATFANTAAGQFARLSEAVHQTEINIGTGLLPTLAGAAEGLNRFFTSASQSEGLRSVFVGLGHDLTQLFDGVKGIAATVGPPLMFLANAASAVVSAIGGTPLLTAVAAYKSLAIASGLAASAQAAFAAITARGVAAIEAENVAVAANKVSLTTQLGAKAAVADADAAATAATVALTEALDANIAAFTGQAAASRLALTGVSTFGAASAATAVEVGALDVAATAEVGTMAALGAGLTGLAAGLPLLGIAIAGAAAGFVYLATRETGFERTTRETITALGDLDKALKHTADLRAKIAGQRDLIKSDKLTVAQDRLGLTDARKALTAPPGTELYAKQILAIKTAAQQLDTALKTLGDDQRHIGALQNQQVLALEAQRKGLASATSEAQSLAQATRAQLAGSLDDVSIRFKTYETAAVRARQETKLNGDVVGKFSDQLSALAAKLDSQKHPIAAADVTLLKEFVDRLGRLPTRKETKVILGLTDAKVTLNQLLTVILPALIPGFAAGGKAAGDAYVAGLSTSLGGAASNSTFPGAVASLLSGLTEKAKKKGASAAADGTAAGADAISKALAKSVADTQAKLRQVGKASGDAISGLRGGLTQLNSDLAVSIAKEVTDINDVVNQAKGNLTSIGQSLASQIGDVLNAPIQRAQAAVQALQNKQSLEDLRRSALLPGGRSLSKDPKKALAELEAAQKHSGFGSGALNSFITKYRSALLTTQADAAQATTSAATRSISDLTNALNNHRISPAQFQAGIANILRKDKVTFKLAGKEKGAEFEQAFRASLTGLFTQAGLISSGPQRPGGGNAPTIIRPLDVLHTDQRDIKRIQREIGNKQIALQHRIAKASEQTAKLTAQLHAAQVAQAHAAARQNSAKKNPGHQSQVSVALTRGK